MGRRPTAGTYTPPSKPVARSLDRITETLREYLEQGGTRTDLLRAAGNDVVELRAMFTRNDAPDWSGRSREYQAAMSEVYNRLNVRGKRREALQAAISFHAGKVIRERADAAELEDAGMDLVPRNARIQRRRDTNAAVAAAAGIQAGATESLPKALAWAATLLEYTQTLDAEALTQVERSAARALVGDCRASLDALETNL